MSFSFIIKNGSKSSRNDFRKISSLQQTKKSKYHRGKRFYSQDLPKPAPSSPLKRLANFVQRRKVRYLIGGSLLLGFGLITEISEMNSVDKIETEIQKKHNTSKELSDLLFNTHVYLRDYKSVQRFKDIKKFSDSLYQTLSNCPFPDTIPRTYALICLTLLCEHSTEARDHILKKIDFVKLTKFVKEAGATEEEVTMFRNAEHGPSNQLSHKVLTRKFYERLLFIACQNEDLHAQLIRAEIIPFTKALIDDSNGEYLFAVQYLKHLSTSERGARELLKENIVPVVHEKLFSEDKMYPEWAAQASVVSESTFIKAQDFLTNMTKRYQSDIDHRYPNISNHLNEILNKGYKTYEESIRTIDMISNAKNILFTVGVGFVYGSIRTFIHNYRHPDMKRAILKKGAIPAAAASGLAMLITLIYESNYKSIWRDERLHVILRLFMVSGSLGYFYGIGKVAPYSIVPYALVYGLKRQDEFDVESLRKMNELRNDFNKKKSEKEKEKKNEEE